MGKQHGSLARAGKVKSQTPVVSAKVDAPKKVTGRAAMRKKYNRRIVNQTDGNKQNVSINFCLF